MQPIVLLSLLIAAAPPEVTVKPSGDGYRAEATEFELVESQSVHEEIARHATNLCAGKEVRWGKFGSTTALGRDLGATPAKVSGYYQEFRCVEPQQVSEATTPSDWKPSAADEADARRIAETYFAMRDAGQMEKAVAMLSAAAVEDRDQWMSSARDFNRQIGDGKRRISAVTWYVNPSVAPRAGTYVALDFVGEYTGVHVYCGYIVLYRLGSGSYEIVREEQTVFERGDAPADPTQVEMMRSAVCRGN